MSRVTLLGPQRLQPTLASTLESLGAGSGRVATITAGWQEREPDDRELHEHLSGRSHNLKLYERAERAFHADPELQLAHHQRQAALRELQDLYNVRLDHAMAAAYELWARPGRGLLLEAERHAALAAIRELDAHHLNNVREVHAAFEARWQPLERTAVQRERQEIQEALAGASAVAIAGGHVAVLLNRLRLFGLRELLEDRVLVAWSAGAMVLSERVVLFHDHPAHGMGNAEVLETGLGICAGVVPLPHARLRLRLDDLDRVALFAGRFAPDACVPMNEGARLDAHDGGWEGSEGMARLRPDGTVGSLEAA
jgi:hypothetical protein